MTYLMVNKKGYHRKGYHRKSFYIHRDGKTIKIPSTEVKPTDISPTEYKIKDVGAKGRGAKLIHIERKGALTSAGYNVYESAEKRHEALKRADKKYGTPTLFRMLQAQVVYRKRTQPQARKVFVEDRNWVEKNLLSKKEARSLTSKARMTLKEHPELRKRK